MTKEIKNTLVKAVEHADETYEKQRAEMDKPEYQSKLKAMKAEPHRMVDYSLFLYPQYERDFEKTLPKHVWTWLQKEAKRMLESHNDVSEVVADHWQSIVAGKVPFGYVVRDH
jgi:hypothetical protein